MAYHNLSTDSHIFRGGEGWQIRNSITAQGRESLEEDLPTALTLPQRHSQTPKPAPNRIPNRQKPPPPTACTSPVTALRPPWDCPQWPPSPSSKALVQGEGAGTCHLWKAEPFGPGHGP